MELFKPKRILVEPDALDYPLTEAILSRLKPEGVKIELLRGGRVTGIPGATPQESYREGKQTLVLGLRRDFRLASCKPSADFEFAIASGCPGGCQYCYLQTHFGKKPYIKIYVNLDQILANIAERVTTNLPSITSFEVASTSDPLAVEHLTGSLAQTISFFGRLDHAYLRVVTKFAAVDSLLDLPHQAKTRFRFSLNTPRIIGLYEQHTATLAERIMAANKMAQAGYPLGFIVAPLFIYPDYQKDYAALFEDLALNLKPLPKDLSFELITHRFTNSAKKVIMERFPGSQLDLDESKRRRKFGRYGMVKHVYPEPDYSELKAVIVKLLTERLPTARIAYFT